MEHPVEEHSAFPNRTEHEAPFAAAIRGLSLLTSAKASF